jgi:hypothetical protein
VQFAEQAQRGCIIRIDGERGPAAALGIRGAMLLRSAAPRLTWAGALVRLQRQRPAKLAAASSMRRISNSTFPRLQ